MVNMYKNIIKCVVRYTDNNKRAEIPIIYVPNIEIFHKVSNLFMNKGYNIHVLNYTANDQGDRYNPLQLIDSIYKNCEKDLAIEMYQKFADRLFFSIIDEVDYSIFDYTRKYFVGLALTSELLYGSPNITLYNIYQLHIMGKTKINSSCYINKLAKMRYVHKVAYAYITAVTYGDEDIKNKVMAAFESVLSPFITNDNVVNKTFNNTISVMDLMSSREMVFLIGDGEEGVCNPLILAVLDQFYTLIDMNCQNEEKVELVNIANFEEFLSSMILHLHTYDDEKGNIIVCNSTTEYELYTLSEVELSSYILRDTRENPDHERENYPEIDYVIWEHIKRKYEELENMSISDVEE